MIEDYDISPGAELSGLSQSSLYLFFLGARYLTSLFSDYDSPKLHFLNFRCLRDATAAYYKSKTTKKQAPLYGPDSCIAVTLKMFHLNRGRGQMQIISKI